MPTDRPKPDNAPPALISTGSSGSEVYASAVAALKQKRRSIWVQVRGASAFSFFVRLSHGKSSTSVTVLENVLDKRVSYFNSVVVVAVADDDDDSSG